jgi:uncharacterized protein YdeI (YjbR/CyaY-like superfamily)
MNPTVDFYFNKAQKWEEEIKKLRLILLDCHLVEELKWGCPCYRFQGSNIALIHVFKEYCAVLFFKGALLKDPQQALIQQTKNVQAARQMRFTNMQQVTDIEPVLKAYILEAVEVEEAGLKVPLKKTAAYSIPDEFQKKLDEIPVLKTAFQALTPGRQRAYLLHFSQPKQSTTRESRIEKSIPAILDGKGLNE